MARRASEERFLQRAEQDQTYIGVSGESYMYFLNQFVTHINLWLVYNISSANSWINALVFQEVNVAASMQYQTYAMCMYIMGTRIYVQLVTVESYHH